MKKRTFKTTKYLYGIEPIEFKDMSYLLALEYKIVKARQLLKKLCSVRYQDRENQRVNDVLEAIEWNQILIDEIKGV